MSTGFTHAVREVIANRAGDLTGGVAHCEVGVACVSDLATQMHHRRPRGNGGSRRPDTNEASNGIAACDACHAHIESQRTEAFDKGWLVRQGHDPAAQPVLRRGLWVLLNADGTTSDAQCQSLMTTGGRCDLPAGHDDPHHRKQYPGHLARWTDESAAAFATQHASRFD